MEAIIMLFILAFYISVIVGIPALFVFICYRIAINRGLSKHYMWFGLLGILGIIVTALIPPPINNYPPYNNNYNNYGPNNNYNNYPNNGRYTPPPPPPTQYSRGNAVNVRKDPLKYCKNCGILLRADSTFCDNCGVKINE